VVGKSAGPKLGVRNSRLQKTPMKRFYPDFTYYKRASPREVKISAQGRDSGHFSTLCTLLFPSSLTIYGV